jgi:hypothetical protein
LAEREIKKLNVAEEQRLAEERLGDGVWQGRVYGRL